MHAFFLLQVKADAARRKEALSAFTKVVRFVNLQLGGSTILNMR